MVHPPVRFVELIEGFYGVLCVVWVLAIVDTLFDRIYQYSRLQDHRFDQRTSKQYIPGCHGTRCAEDKAAKRERAQIVDWARMMLKE